MITSGWKKNDVAVCQLISLLGYVRLEVFKCFLEEDQKKTVQKKVVSFVKEFMNFVNLKQVLRAVKTEIPQLLGYKQASIYMHDAVRDNLYTVNLDEDAESRAKEHYGTFEVEFAFEESQVVRFPTSMGVNGFAYHTNSVNYFSYCKGILGQRKFFSSLYCCGTNVLPFASQKEIGQKLGADFPFNSKADNFLALDQINNLAITSIIDEEIPGMIRVVGTMQLYNKQGLIT